MSTGFGLDHLPYGVVDGHCVVRYEDHVLDLSTVPGLPPSSTAPRSTGSWRSGAPCGRTCARRSRACSRPGRRARRDLRAGAAARGRRLRRLLLVDRARHERRAQVPPGRSAPARLEGAADRLPRPRRLDRRLRHRDRAPARAAAELRPHRELDFELELGFVTARASPSATRSRRARCATTSSASCSSTTGARGTSSASSTGRSARSWASPSRPRSRPGSRRWLRSSRTSCPPASRTPSRTATCRPAATGRSTSSSKSTSTATSITRGNARHLYWTFPQQLAHATVNGAAVRPGDLFASGTISGSEPGTHGCLLEAGAGFLADGDTVTLRGRAGTIELGAVRGTIVSEP